MMRTIDIQPHERVSYSEIKKFLLCTQEHDYVYVQGLEKVGNKSEALVRGDINHAVLGEYCRARLDAETKGSTRAHETAVLSTTVWLMQQEWSSFEAPLADKVKQLFAFFAEVNPLQGYKIRSFEQSFAVKLPTGRYYVFSPDLVVEHAVSGRTYVIDFKTIFRFYSQNILELDMQLPSYVWGLRQFGVKVDDAMFLQFYHGFGKAAKAHDAIRLTPLNISETRIKSVVDQIHVAAEAIEAEYVTARAANDLVCNRCSMARLCIEQLNGRNTDAMFPVIYKKKDNRVMEEVYVND